MRPAPKLSDTLTVDQIRRVDLRLDPGGIAETVQVQANVVALDTASAANGSVTAQRKRREISPEATR